MLENRTISSANRRWLRYFPFTLIPVSDQSSFLNISSSPAENSLGEMVTEKVESELKDFVSQKLEELLGMGKQAEEAGFSKEDMQALKLVASKITNKVPSSVAPPPPPLQLFEAPPVEQQEPMPLPLQEEVMPGVTKVVEEGLLRSTSNDPRVAQIDGPTDKMKKVKPKGVRMAAPNTSNEMMQIAAQQAQQAEARMAAMSGGQQLLGGLSDNNAMPNFDSQEIFR